MAGIARAQAIGVAGPLTGPRSAYAPSLRLGALLAVEHWQQAYGHESIPELLWGDDQADVAVAERVARTFIDERVSGVVGHFNGSCANRVADLYAAASIPLLLPAATLPAITMRNLPGVFRLCGRDDEMGQQIGQWLHKTLRGAEILLVHDTSPYGESVTHATALALASRGVSYSGPHGWRPASAPDLSDEIWRLLMHQGNVAVVMSGSHAASAAFTKYLRERGVQAPLLLTDDALVPDYLTRCQGHAEGVWIIGTPPLPQAAGVAAWFAAEFRARAGEEPTYYAAATFAALQILLAALWQSHTAPASTIERITSRQWPTLLGPVTFLAHGDRKEMAWGVWQVRSLRFALIETTGDEA